MNGAMAIPNLIGLLLLSGVVARETRAYFARENGEQEVIEGITRETPEGELRGWRGRGESVRNRTAGVRPTERRPPHSLARPRERLGHRARLNERSSPPREPSGSLAARRRRPHPDPVPLRIPELE